MVWGLKVGLVQAFGQGRVGRVRVVDVRFLGIGGLGFWQVGEAGIVFGYLGFCWEPRRGLGRGVWPRWFGMHRDLDRRASYP